jgi:lipoprotein-anchoring transpeptidase ErfK/SrfK
MRDHRASFPLAFHAGLLIALALLVGTPAVAAAAPTAPVWLAPSQGLSARFATVAVLPGADTASLTLTCNGAVVSTVECSPGVAVTFPACEVAPGGATLAVTASDGLGGTIVASRWVARVTYPWATCIVIDRSDYRLYWIRDDRLVKAYPIAIGKRRTPTPSATWIVGRKERTPARSVFGPRRLRLFRLVRSRSRGRVRYSYTRYGVHGTNQPWVIGTMASHGCIRLYNADIRELWPQVPTGTRVQTRQ